MIILCDPDAGMRERLRTRLPDHQIAEFDGLAAVRAATDDANGATTVVIGPGVAVDDAMALASAMEDRHRPVAVILVTRYLDPTVLRRALRSGVVDVLTLDAPDEEFTEAIGRAHEEATSRAPNLASGTEVPGDELGRVTTVFSTKGGCGKSLVATNLAILLEQRVEGEVALVDLDLQSGDLAIMLQVMPDRSIYEAAQSIDRMDVEALSGYLTPHASGVFLLAAPLEPSLAEAVTADSVAKILTLLRQRFAHIVIDGPAFFTDQVLAAIDQSDMLVLVGSLDVPSVKNLRMAMNTLHQLGHPRERILTVLNRADSSVGLRVPEVEKSLGTNIDVRIPSSRDVPLSVNQGAPLAGERRKSDVVAAIADLIPRLAPETVASTDEGRSLFSRRR